MKVWMIIQGIKRRDRMQRFKDARDIGGIYLLSVCRPDGGLGSPELGVMEYNKALTAFQVCGYSNAANLLCDWIRTNGMTSEGDFGPRPVSFEDFRYTYPNSWVIIGAHRLGHFDLSQKGMDFLMSFRDPQSGGFFSSSTRRDADTEQDLIYVSFCGLAALYTGRIEVARAVGGWMQTVMNDQPDFPKKLYTVYKSIGGVQTVYDPKKSFRYVVSNDATGVQAFFQLGAASAFLASLYRATCEIEWLDLAMEYMRFAEVANDNLFCLLQAGKVGWAASLLYSITGEDKYKAMAIRIGDNIIAAQSKKGYWNFPGMNTPNNGLTAEMVVWLDAIHQLVGQE